MEKDRTPHPGPQFLKNAGEAGKLILDFQWDSSPAGPMDQWPRRLRTTLGIVLHSALPMLLYWGKELITFNSMS